MVKTLFRCHKDKVKSVCRALVLWLEYCKCWRNPIIIMVALILLNLKNLKHSQELWILERNLSGLGSDSYSLHHHCDLVSSSNMFLLSLMASGEVAVDAVSKLLSLQLSLRTQCQKGSHLACWYHESWVRKIRCRRIGYPLQCSWASLVAQLVKNPPAMWETWVWPLGWKNSPREGKGYPLQYSGLENSMDYIVHGGHKELYMTEQLS